MKNYRLPIALMLLTSSLVLYARGTAPQGTEQLKVTLAAGSVVEQGKVVVKLAWSVDEGWLPEGGFRLIRVGTPAPLTAQPLKPAARFANVEALTVAKRRLTKPVAVQQVRQRESSAPVFEAAASAAKSAASGKKGTSSQAIAKAIAAAPAVSGFFSKLKEKSAAQAPKSASVLKSAIVDPDVETASMRERLMLSAAFDESVGRDLGLRFTDTQVAKGQTCQYQLRATVNGVDTLLASTTIVVGNDSNSAKPVVATPLQIAQKHVQLHIELPAVVPDELGALTFDIFRGEGGARVQLNKEPILPAMVETSAGKLTPTLVGFEDKAAPFGRNVYTVHTKDTFGRHSQPTVVTVEVLDLAGPAASPAVAAIRQNQISQPGSGGLSKVSVTRQSLVPGPSSVRVVWVPAKEISDGSPFSNGAIAYRVDRTDVEATPNQTKELAGPIAGQPANLGGIDVRTLCKLRPDIAAWVTKALSAAKATSGRGDGTAAPFITEAVYDQKVLPFLQTYQKHMPAPVELLEYVDNSPVADRIFTYQVTPILVRNQREAAPASTSQVGIPATVAPPMPTITVLKDDPAPQTSAGLKALAQGSLSNAALLQLAPGMRGPQGVIKENATANPKQLGSEMLKSVAPAAGVGKGLSEPAPQFNPAPSVQQKVINKPVGEGKLSAMAKVNVKGGVPTSYGRMVTLTWTQPAYTSKVQYRVFRANGTGFQSTSASTGAGVPDGALRASEGQGPAGKPTVASQGKAVQTGGSKIQRTKRSGLPLTIGMGKAAKAFLLDGTPSAEEYIELGLTKPGASSFIDLLPVSQASTFYYYLLPTNRWGTTGTPSPKGKIKIKPSLPPSTPALQGAFAQADGSIQIRIVPNLEIEDVTAYKLMRLEVPVPPSPAAAPVTGPAKPTFATGAKAKVAGPAYTKNVEGQSLAAANGGSGATKFGIESHSSPFTAVGAVQGQPGTAQLGANVSKAFDLSAYTLVSTHPPGTPDANGLLSFSDPMVVAGKYYAYRIVAVNSAALASEASQFLDAGALKIKADPPTAAGTYDPPNERVVLTITAPASGANAFVIERISNSPGAQWIKLGVVPVVAQFQDTAALKGRTYKYRVSTIDVAGNVSIPSAEITVVVP
jgi:hypothetical protein